MSKFEELDYLTTSFCEDKSEDLFEKIISKAKSHAAACKREMTFAIRNEEDEVVDKLINRLIDEGLSVKDKKKLFGKKILVITWYEKFEKDIIVSTNISPLNNEE